MVSRICLTVVLVLASAAIFAASDASAGERAFTFTYETTVMPKGAFEFEQWVTWKRRKDTDPNYDRLEFREEVEIGITDEFQLAFYLDTRYTDGSSSSDDGKLEQRDVAVEAIYQLTDPNEDPFGTALYAEVKLGDEIFEIEGKFLVQKNIGKVILAWNGIVELEWEGDRYHEDKMVLGQAMGASYQFSPKLTVGAELLHEVERADFARWGDHEVYGGPVISFRTKSFWITITHMFQLTNVPGAVDDMTRVLIGFDF